MGKKQQVGAQIRVMRKSRNMTQEDLAKAIGQSASSITMYENGRREPDFETLEAIADTFNVPMSSLLHEEEDEEHPKNDDVRLLLQEMNRMTPEQIEQVKGMFRIMFKLSEKGMKEDDA